MADDRLLLQRLISQRDRIDRVGAEHHDLREIVTLIEQQLSVEQAFRRRHEVKLAEVSAMMDRILRRLDLKDDSDRT